MMFPADSTVSYVPIWLIALFQACKGQYKFLMLRHYFSHTCKQLVYIEVNDRVKQTGTTFNIVPSQIFFEAKKDNLKRYDACHMTLALEGHDYLNSG